MTIKQFRMETNTTTSNIDYFLHQLSEENLKHKRNASLATVLKIDHLSEEEQENIINSFKMWWLKNKINLELSYRLFTPYQLKWFQHLESDTSS